MDERKKSKTGGLRCKNRNQNIFDDMKVRTYLEYIISTGGKEPGGRKRRDAYWGTKIQTDGKMTFRGQTFI